MTDSRSSENPKFPEMRRRGFFDDVPTGDDLITAPESTAVAAETHNVLVEIAKHLRIRNLIAYNQAYPMGLGAHAIREEIEKGLDL